MTHVCLVVLVSLAGPAVTAHGQKAPGLGYAYPPAIPVGRTSEYSKPRGFDFTVDMEWFVHDNQVRLKATGPPGDLKIDRCRPLTGWDRAPALRRCRSRERSPRGSTSMQIVPAGLVRFQVANANGSSSTAIIYLSRSPEIIELRSATIRSGYRRFPSDSSGRLSRLTEVDRYTLCLDHDGPVSVDLMARRLGSDFHGVLQVHDGSGKPVADFADTEGLDGGVMFAVRKGEFYTISVHDVDSRGDRARLIVSPWCQACVRTIPAAACAGLCASWSSSVLGWPRASRCWNRCARSCRFPWNRGESPISIGSRDHRARSMCQSRSRILKKSYATERP